MKKAVFLAVFTMAAVWAHAAEYDYPYLTFTTSSGIQSVSTTGLTMTISGTNLVATNNSTTLTLPLSSLTAMEFTSSATTGISTVNNTGKDKSSVAVYTLSGVSLGNFASGDIARASLKSGVYLFQSKGKTNKIIIP